MAYNVRFVQGTFEQYKNASKDSNTLYFLTDINELYLGEKKFTNTEAVKALETLVGKTSVDAQIKAAIDALKLSEAYEAKGAAKAVQGETSTTVKDIEDAIAAIKDGTTIDSFIDVENKFSEVEGVINGKVASVTAGDNSVTIAGTTTAPTVAVKISTDADNALTLDTDKGLKVNIPAAAEYSIVKAENSGEYAAVYNLTKGGAIVGASINIPKDMVVSEGSVVENPERQPAGTYIKLVLQNVAEPLYINVGNLIEYVTSGSQATDMVVITINDNHEVTATITDGTVTKAKLEVAVQTSLGLADSALQKTDITTGTANGTIAVEGTDVEIKGLDTAAYKKVEDFDVAGAAANVLGKADDTSSANTVYGAKKLATEVLGTEADSKNANTVYGAKAYADSLNTAMEEKVEALETAIGEGGSVGAQIDAKIEELKSSVTQATGADGVSATVSQEKGKLTSVTVAIAAKTYDTYGSANAVKTELLGQTEATAEDNTIAGAKAYTDKALTWSTF